LAVFAITNIVELYRCTFIQQFQTHTDDKSKSTSEDYDFLDSDAVYFGRLLRSYRNNLPPSIF
jgi:hypothetical protein